MTGRRGYLSMKSHCCFFTSWNDLDIFVIVILYGSELAFVVCDWLTNTRSTFSQYLALTWLPPFADLSVLLQCLILKWVYWRVGVRNDLVELLLAYVSPLHDWGAIAHDLLFDHLHRSGFGSVSNNFYLFLLLLNLQLKHLNLFGSFNLFKKSKLFRVKCAVEVETSLIIVVIILSSDSHKSWLQLFSAIFHGVAAKPFFRSTHFHGQSVTTFRRNTLRLHFLRLCKLKVDTLRRQHLLTPPSLIPPRNLHLLFHRLKTYLRLVSSNWKHLYLNYE